MRIAVAADHAGFPLKQPIIDELRRLGHDVVDLGTDSEAPVDYPDYAQAAGEAVRGGGCERGVLICGSGVGASVAANKIRAVRAAVCHDTYSAHQGVEHDDMNILTLGARVIGPALAIELVGAFVGARFSGEERHVRRLNKVLAIESRYTGEKENING
ncbi:MAG: ribose 5-phosphate isomerase B [Dehalococcoidia bacterium]|nr:ribose 5-phosphate isomerase B [Dehalococcoidia bacterium]